jgi:hypothetical protein
MLFHFSYLWVGIEKHLYTMLDVIILVQAQIIGRKYE